MTVEATLPIRIDCIKIEYGFNSINRDGDKEPFLNKERYTTIFDRQDNNNLVTDYGENDFLVTYKEYYFQFKFKTWNKSIHSYYFKIYEQDSIPHLEIKIEGENKLHFTRAMIKTKDAHKYRCNTPLDSIGIIIT